LAESANQVLRQDTRYAFVAEREREAFVAEREREAERERGIRCRERERERQREREREMYVLQSICVIFKQPLRADTWDCGLVHATEMPFGCFTLQKLYDTSSGGCSVCAASGTGRNHAPKG
jgi:hypothetical protein